LEYLGLVMPRIRGRYRRKTARTHGGVRCVRGVRKFQLMIMTVMRMVRMFMMNVKSRYLAISGMLLDVGGRIFDTSSRKTMSASRIDIHMVVFSPASDGR